MEEFVYTGRGQRVPKDVVSVRFAPSVIEVEERAFLHCTQLREAVLNDGLKKIRYGAFEVCTSLDDITIPSTVTEIEHSAFYKCNSLREVRLHEGLQTIGGGVFRGCSSLESINIPSTLTKIGNYSFSNCNSLREVVLNDGLEKIGEGTFRDCTSLERIIIPSTVTGIGKYAFQYCRGLRGVRLHERLEKIGDRAFERCNSLERFTFPAISTRLNNVIEVQIELIRTRRLNEIDAIRGDMIARRGSELFVPGAVLRGGSSWNTIKASLDNLVSWIRYHEIKEETTLFELALWKARLDQADGATDINRDAYRIEMPGPVKEAILKYL